MRFRHKSTLLHKYYLFIKFFQAVIASLFNLCSLIAKEGLNTGFSIRFEVGGESSGLDSEGGNISRFICMV